MKTKFNEKFGDLVGKSHPIVEVYYEFAQLKNLFRQGWLKRGISEAHCESVAEHCFGVGLMSYMIAEEYKPELNSLHCMRLGIFHESGEPRGGDVTPHDGVSAEDKYNTEYAGAKRIFERLPNGQKYLNLFVEFEEQKTPESKLVKQVDRLEMALEAG
jgi:putative hydrolase of HD superfamily